MLETLTVAVESDGSGRAIGNVQPELLDMIASPDKG